MGNPISALTTELFGDIKFLVKGGWRITGQSLCGIKFYFMFIEVDDEEYFMCSNSADSHRKLFNDCCQQLEGFATVVNPVGGGLFLMDIEEEESGKVQLDFQFVSISETYPLSYEQRTSKLSLVKMCIEETVKQLSPSVYSCVFSGDW